MLLLLAALLTYDEPPAVKAEPTYDYRWVRGDALHQVHLYDGKAQIGTWRYDLKEYYPFHADRDSWGFPKPKPPSGAPAIPPQLKRQFINNNGRTLDMPIPCGH